MTIEPAAAAPRIREQFLGIDCGGAQCLAVYSPVASASPQVGVVIVVGGPQYRVGSHRQFVLLARDLARAGIPAIRFDYRGIGDSDGEARTFESIDDDIAAAVDALSRESGVRRVVLWGLCDGASASLIYAASDPRVVGIVAVNPWARTQQGEARTRLRHYYLARILSLDFWRRLFARRVDMRTGGTDLIGAIKAIPRGSPSDATGYLGRMSSGWRAFEGAVLLLLSGRDLTAREFESWVASHANLRRLLSGTRAEVQRFEEADHTFSTRAWRDAVSQATQAWIERLPRGGRS